MVQQVSIVPEAPENQCFKNGAVHQYLGMGNDRNKLQEDTKSMLYFSWYSKICSTTNWLLTNSVNVFIVCCLVVLTVLCT